MNKKPEEVWVGNLRPGSKFRLDLGGREGSKFGIVVSHSTGQTVVKWQSSSALAAVLGEEPASTSGNVGISTRTAVVPIDKGD